MRNDGSDSTSGWEMVAVVGDGGCAKDGGRGWRNHFHTFFFFLFFNFFFFFFFVFVFGKLIYNYRFPTC